MLILNYYLYRITHTCTKCQKFFVHKLAVSLMGEPEQCPVWPSFHLDDTKAKTTFALYSASRLRIAGTPTTGTVNICAFCPSICFPFLGHSLIWNPAAAAAENLSSKQVTLSCPELFATSLHRYFSCFWIVRPVISCTCFFVISLFCDRLAESTKFF